jgi:hypothetical protein
MRDSIFDKMMAYLQLKGTSTSSELQGFLQIHPGNLSLHIETAKMLDLVRLCGVDSWQLTDAGRKYCNLRAVASKEENRPKEETGQFIVLGPSNHNLGSYKSFHGAEVQARNFAIKSPGKTYHIVKVVAEVFCDGPQVRKF